jgi:endoribonuclease Dicer
MDYPTESEDPQNEFIIEDLENFEPRPYQIAVLEQAKTSNTIAFLDTGTGKTYIALMLTKATPGKAVFLAPVRALVRQQAKAARYLDIPTGEFVGNKYDDWDMDSWSSEFEKHKLMVFTPQLFLNCLRAGFLNLHKFSLLIIDECHHCHDRHPYFFVMREFYHCNHAQPKVFGMTASPIVHGKLDPTCLMDDLRSLCCILHCNFAPVDREDIEKVANKPRPVIRCHEKVPKVNPENLVSLLQDVEYSRELLAVKSEISTKGCYLYEALGKSAYEMYLRDIAEKCSSSGLKAKLKRIASGEELSVNSRVKELTTTLLEHFAASKNEAPKAIIFVDRRVVAWYLSRILNNLPEFQAKNIISNELLGYNHSSNLLDPVKMSDSEQRTILESFRSDQFNILIATSVAEEGLDIPSCDLVIRFDSLADNLRVYVQSRGRARKQDSKFIMLVEQNFRSECEKRIKDFDYTIEWLKQIADRQVILPPTSRLKQLECYEVSSTGAKVCTNWAEDFLKDYCKYLPNDQYCSVEPEIYAKKVNPRVVGMNELSVAYEGVVRLPKHSEICEFFSPSIYPTEKKAKEMACLSAVEILHRTGMLTDNLKHMWKQRNKVTIDFSKYLSGDLERSEESENKFIRKEDNEPRVMRLPQDSNLYNTVGTVSTQYYIYSLEVQPAIGSLATSHLGMISPIPLNTTPFKLYPWNITRHSSLPKCSLHSKSEEFNENYCWACNNYAVYITPRLLSTSKFDKEKLSKYKMFHAFLMMCIIDGIGSMHQYLNKEIRAMLSNPEYVLKMPACILPLKNGSIDEEIMNNSVQFVNEYLVEKKTPPSLREVLSEGDANTLVGKIVFTPHNNYIYRVIAVDKQGPDTEFYDKKSNSIVTITRYFQERYNISVPSDDISLVVQQIGRFRQGTRYLRTRNSKLAQRYDAYIPSSLACLFEIPPEILHWGRISPSLYFRMNQNLTFGEMSSELNLPISLIKIAMSCTSSLEEYDYQRFEILGDNVLKLLVSLELFRMNSEAHEGILSFKRSECTSNEFLCLISIQKKFYRSMQTRPEKNNRWVPPGLVNYELYVEENDDEFYEKRQTELNSLEQPEEELLENINEISLKQLADVVEALIGAAYTFGGLKAAYDMIISLNILQFEDGEMSPMTEISSQFTNLKMLESRIGMEFSTPGWVQEAFLHPTYGASRNYQRLEFIGDAILDFIVLKYFYEKYPQASPGQLTKLKIQGVNNKLCAYFGAELGLIDYIQYISPTLKSHLEVFRASYCDLKRRISGNLELLSDKGLKVVADIFESFIAAIFLNSDYSTTERIVLSIMQEKLDSFIISPS